MTMYWDEAFQQPTVTITKESGDIFDMHSTDKDGSLRLDVFLLMGHIGVPQHIPSLKEYFVDFVFFQATYTIV
jgi:hypothetical protein